MKSWAAILGLLVVLLLPSSLGKGGLGEDPKTCPDGTSLQPWPGGGQQGRKDLCVNQSYLAGDTDWKALVSSLSVAKPAPQNISAEAWAAARDQTAGAQKAAREAIDNLQTDSLGRPTWRELDAMRAQVDAAQSQVDANYRDPLTTKYEQAGSDIRAERLTFLASTLLPLAIGVGLAIGLAAFLAARWKKRTEYYRPYASKKTIATPETVATIIGASVVLIGIVAALALGLLQNLDRLATIFGGS